MFTGEVTDKKIENAPTVRAEFVVDRSWCVVSVFVQMPQGTSGDDSGGHLNNFAKFDEKTDF